MCPISEKSAKASHWIAIMTMVCVHSIYGKAMCTIWHVWVWSTYLQFLCARVLEGISEWFKLLPFSQMRCSPARCLGTSPTLRGHCEWRIWAVYRQPPQRTHHTVGCGLSGPTALDMRPMNKLQNFPREKTLFFLASGGPKTSRCSSEFSCMSGMLTVFVLITISGELSYSIDWVNVLFWKEESLIGCKWEENIQEFLIMKQCRHIDIGLYNRFTGHITLSKNPPRHIYVKKKSKHMHFWEKILKLLYTKIN